MKIHEYNEMMRWLTRPAGPDPRSMPQEPRIADREPYNMGGRVGMKPGGLVEPGVTHYATKYTDIEAAQKYGDFLKGKKWSELTDKVKGQIKSLHSWRMKNPEGTTKFKTLTIGGKEFNLPATLFKGGDDSQWRAAIKFLENWKQNPTVENYVTLLKKEDKTTHSLLKRIRNYYTGGKSHPGKDNIIGTATKKILDSLKVDKTILNADELKEFKRYTRKVTQPVRAVIQATPGSTKTRLYKSAEKVIKINNIFKTNPSITLNALTSKIHGKDFARAGDAGKLDKATKVSDDVAKYLEALKDAREIPRGLKTQWSPPTGNNLKNIMEYITSQSQGFRFREGTLRNYKYSIRDSLMKLPPGSTRNLENKLRGIKGVLDHAVGLSATFDVAPGYTEAFQILEKSVNDAKGIGVDRKFGPALRAALKGDFSKVDAYNETAAKFQKNNPGVDVPFIEKGGDPRKTVKYFDQFSPAAQKDILEVAEKGVAIKTGARPLTQKLLNDLSNAPDALKLKIGGVLGCRPAAAEGGRIGLKVGSGLMQCISSKLDNNPQGTLAKVAKEVPETRGPIRSALGMTGKAFGRFIMGALGPTGIAGITYGAGFDPKKATDRMGIEVEAALAPELVRATIGATKGMKNRGAQKVVQQLLNLGMKTPTALRVARIAQPLGLLALGGEGLYKMYKEGHFEKERMMPSLMDKEAYAGAQQEQFDVNQPMFNQGGRVGFAKGPKDPSKRVFLKGVAMASMIPILGKYFKIAAPATKAAAQYTGPILEGLGNKLKWVQLLAKRLWNEGEDATQALATKEREVVMSGKLESGDNVYMHYDMDTKNVRFSVEGAQDVGQSKYIPQDTKSGAFHRQYDLEYKAPTIIDEGKYAGNKTKSEVKVVEETPHQLTPEDVELDVSESTVDSALSDLTELEAFAKKKTVKQIHNKKGTKPKDVAPDYEPPDWYDLDYDID